MQLSRFLFGLGALLLPVALAGTTWLYLYPLFHGCAFPQPSHTSLPLHDARAPFRLLALGDPQLEGDSSLPDPATPLFPSLRGVAQKLREVNFDPPDVRDVLAAAARGAVADLGVWLEGCRKTVDLWGNDWYLAHIVRSLRWATEPTHVAVLGDLLGSQWITDGEFEKRAGRYWGTVMRGLERVPDEIMGSEAESDHYDEPEYVREKTWGGTREVLGEDGRWADRVINIAGNHDIGYAGDIDEQRVERFERAFGSVNWDIWFELPRTPTNTSSDDEGNDGTPTDTSSSSSSKDTSSAGLPASTSTPDAPALRLVVLNTMNLDTPAYTDSLQQDTYAFMNHIITTSRPVTSQTHATILLTHIPLHKAPGICVDSPYFDYFDSGHGVREQNMLSEHGSRIVLESLFGLSRHVHAEGAGLGRRGVILNGHDHAGCDTLHWIRQPGAPPCDARAVERPDAYWHDEDAGNSTAAGLGLALDADADAAPNGTTDADADDTEHEDTWQAVRFPPRQYDVRSSSSKLDCTHIPSAPHLREITLRSMMGDFSGHAGFLSAWFDPLRGEQGEWVMEFSSCGVGVQHWWWGVHIVDLILVVAWMGGCVAWVVERVGGGKREGGKTSKTVVGVERGSGGKMERESGGKMERESGGKMERESGGKMERESGGKMERESAGQSLGETRRG